ncbi:MAG: hypothetical protein JOZ01_00065, partial [Candidatus Eremiobacteraeota bacterium]|nr:hypothetical protein [Candidatus Eremiobacteraeota bacterium]
MKLRFVAVAFATTAIVAGCSGGSGAPSQPFHAPPTSPPTASPSPSPTPTRMPSQCATGNFTQGAVKPSGLILTLATTHKTLFRTTIDMGALPAGDVVTLAQIFASQLPAPLFTQGAGNKYVFAFCVDFGSTAPSKAPLIQGGPGFVPPSVAKPGSVLNIAVNRNNTWVDVGTALVAPNGSFTAQPPTANLPGVTATGKYLIYVPGIPPPQLHLGLAIAGDDGLATGGAPDGFQVVQFEDRAGNLLPAPAPTYVPLPAAFDIDNVSLTNDAFVGALVDGGSRAYFFKGLPQRTIMMLPNSVDISAFGGDSDSVASLQNGDEVIATGDGPQLAQISGLLSGNPVVANAITVSSPKDGLVTSFDSKAMLARDSSGNGIDVFSITAVAPHAGTLGGRVAYDIKLVSTISNSDPNFVTPVEADGREGMAFSPQDSTRALVVGTDHGGNPSVGLITGIPNSATMQTLRLQIPNAHLRLHDAREVRGRRAGRAGLTLSGLSGPVSVVVAPNGRDAYVAGSGGIVGITGVDTGSLTQVGSPIAPVVQLSNGK